MDPRNRDVLVAGQTEFTIPGGTRVGGVRSECMYLDDDGNPLPPPCQAYRDIWLRRYSVDGTLRWTTQFGTRADEAISAYGGQLGIDHVDGAVYIGGATQGAFDGEDADNACGGGRTGADCPYYSGFITKISRNGTELWT